jgi:hypothetical protein
MVYLRTILTLIACTKASLLEAASCSCTSVSTFYKLLEIERFSLSGQRGVGRAQGARPWTLPPPHRSRVTDSCRPLPDSLLRVRSRRYWRGGWRRSLEGRNPSCGTAGASRLSVFRVHHSAWHAIMVPRSTQLIFSPAFTPAPTTTTVWLSAPVAAVQSPLPSSFAQIISKVTGGGEATTSG